MNSYPSFLFQEKTHVHLKFLSLQKREVNKILADIIKHMTPDRAFEDHYSRLQSVVSKILTHMKDFSQVFALVGFDLVYFLEIDFS